ncbi:hypothetical protein MMC30_000570, partial [Trapelia coarctata]|nr:hypothetical protein [Trapelia coarctata]
MAASQDTPRAPRPSLYAAIRLAALVQQFRRLLKERVKSRAQLSKEQCQAFGSLALENLGG